MQLKHYIGSKVQTPEGVGTIVCYDMRDNTVCVNTLGNDSWTIPEAATIILRPLTDASEEECNEMGFSYPFGELSLKVLSKYQYTFKELDYARSRHFDVEGLIQQGKAIDATTLTPNPYC